jgi:hypothetical protein
MIRHIIRFANINEKQFLFSEGKNCIILTSHLDYTLSLNLQQNFLKTQKDVFHESCLLLSKTYRNPVFQLWRKYMTVGFVKQCGLIK